MAAARVATFVLSAVASVILARNLEASDYGVVGFCLIVTGFLARFGDLGINSALVQRSEAGTDVLNTGFTVRLITGTGAFAAAFAAASLVPRLLDHPSGSAVIRVLSLTFVINSFALVPGCLLTRELRFGKLVLPQIASAVVSASVSIVLALSGFRFWSIVIGNLAANIASPLVLNLIRPTRIRLQMQPAVARELLHFGVQVFGSGLVIFTLFNADNFVIGSVLGATALGFYALAFNWGSMICSVLQETVHSVLFPTLSRVQKDPHTLKATYLRVLEVTTFVGFLANACLFVCAEEFLVLALGRGSTKWIPALGVLRILSVYGAVRVTLEPVGSVIMALGLPRLILRANLVAGAVELGLLYPVLVRFGIEGVGVLVTLAYGLQYVVYCRALRESLGLSLSEVWRAVRPALLCGMAIVALTTAVAGSGRQPTWSWALAEAAGCVGGYVLAYGMATRWKLLGEARSLIAERGRSRQPL